MSYWSDINLFKLPPLHPLLVNFTAALLPISVVSDWLGKFTKRPSLRGAGFWTLFWGTLVTPLTAAAGWYWMNQLQETPTPRLITHKYLGLSICIALWPLLLWRWRSLRRDTAPTWLYLMTMTILVLLLACQGHIGALMNFGTGAAE